MGENEVIFIGSGETEANLLKLKNEGNGGAGSRGKKNPVKILPPGSSFSANKIGIKGAQKGEKPLLRER